MAFLDCAGYGISMIIISQRMKHGEKRGELMKVELLYNNNAGIFTSFIDISELNLAEGFAFVSQVTNNFGNIQHFIKPLTCVKLLT